MRRSWYRRNRRWFVPLLIVTSILLIASLVGGFFWLIKEMLHSSYPYELAVKTASASPEVSAMIGSPVQVGWLSMGQVNFNGPDGNVSLSVPISGPSGKGDIIVAAKKHANHWTFESFEVDVEGHDEPIQLRLPDAVTDVRPSKTTTAP